MNSENNIEIKSIEIKDGCNNNAIFVEIKNDAEYLIAAHNASKEAHHGIVQELEGKINALNGTINEIEDNMVSNSNLPQKLSELENDMNFVSESTLIQAIETRGLINNTTLNEKEANINNLITTNTNTLNTKIENLKQKVIDLTDPEIITTMCMPSEKQVIYISSFTTGEFNFVMPANGVLAVGGRAKSDVGMMTATRVSANTEQAVTVYPKDHIGSFEMLVNKNETVRIWTQNFYISHVKFSYLNGVAPKDEE